MDHLSILGEGLGLAGKAFGGAMVFLRDGTLVDSYPLGQSGLLIESVKEDGNTMPNHHNEEDAGSRWLES